MTDLRYIDKWVNSAPPFPKLYAKQNNHFCLLDFFDVETIFLPQNKEMSVLLPWEPGSGQQSLTAQKLRGLEMNHLYVTW